MRRCPFCAHYLRLQFKPGTVQRMDLYECGLCGFKEIESFK
jgi:hypothetical protein